MRASYKTRLENLTAAMLGRDKVCVVPPLIVVHSPEFPQTPESEIVAARALQRPVIHVRFGPGDDGQLCLKAQHDRA
jgi:hypothetical protein